ncbi:MAG: phosphatidate cytidylyltransferase [Bacteroidales bacterium]
MILRIYILILVYFSLGAISFYFINRHKEASEARKSWVKLISYFIIINLLFFSIVFNTQLFRFLAVIIIAVGFYELAALFWRSGYSRKGFFLLSTCLFVILSYGFYIFSGMDMGVILFSFLILSIFDGFSQITGQLWGRRKLCQSVSPGKTVEGLIGGALVAILSSVLAESLIIVAPPKAIWLGAGVVLFAFIGDFLSSCYKRRYGVKDFSNIIPGHGGFLDRFDSLISGGAWVAFNGFITAIAGSI